MTTAYTDRILAVGNRYTAAEFVHMVSFAIDLKHYTQEGK